MRLQQYLGLTFLLLASHLLGQQVKFIDLTTLTQRVELRYPLHCQLKMALAADMEAVLLETVE
jgi:hypothetical protein